MCTNFCDSTASFRVSGKEGDCVLYQADKPIRGITIDINFASSLQFMRYFSFNGRIHSVMTCEDLMGAEVCRVNLLEQNAVMNSGQRGEAQPLNFQGGESSYWCFQVETVEITHYSSPACLLCVLM